LDYAKYPQYVQESFEFQFSDKKEELKPYRYVRTFSKEEKTQKVSEMDKEELQSYINRLIGAKSLDGAIKERSSS